MYGNLLTLPVTGGLMYVQPVYATRQLGDASFPELAFVIVSYDDTVGIGDSLNEALADVLGVEPGTTPPPPPDTGNNNGGNNGGNNPPTGTINEQIQQKLTQAQAAFDAANAASAEGDTVEWARQIERAQKFINEAVTLSEGRRQPTTP